MPRCWRKPPFPVTSAFSSSSLGMGAIVLNGARIGRNCIIGAGALVPENRTIPDGSLVVGLPGKVMRELTEDEIAGNRASAQRYVANWRRFKDDLLPL